MTGTELPPLRLLLDQGIPADAAQLFRQLGYQCRHVSEMGMHKAEDEDILAAAGHSNAVVITLDSDFHALVAVRGLRGPSVVRLRREGCRAEMVITLLHPVLERYCAELERGALISVTEHRTACRRLPIGSSTA